VDIVYVLKKIVNVNNDMVKEDVDQTDRTRDPRGYPGAAYRTCVRACVGACAGACACTQCARALCYYILSVVPDAGAGPCHWLLLVSYSGTMYFWSTPRAPLYLILA